MPPDRFFRGFDLHTGTWTDSAARVSGALFVVLALSVLVLGRKQGDRYDNHLAWLRAFAYFSFCFALSAATGVLERVIELPQLTATKLESPAFMILTLCFLVVIVQGYFIAWPKGTYYEDRKLYWTTYPFGVIWGVAEAQLHLASWALLEMSGASRIWIALAQVGMMTLTFPWHVLYWDRYISPSHNILEWNPNKVLRAHVPNTMTAVLYFALFGDAAFYVAIEALALVASSVAQRFPPPWKSEWHGRPILKDGGVKAEVLGLDAKTLKPSLRPAPMASAKPRN